MCHPPAAETRCSTQPRSSRSRYSRKCVRCPFVVRRLLECDRCQRSVARGLSICPFACLPACLSVRVLETTSLMCSCLCACSLCVLVNQLSALTSYAEKLFCNLLDEVQKCDERVQEAADNLENIRSRVPDVEKCVRCSLVCWMMQCHAWEVVTFLSASAPCFGRSRSWCWY